MGLLGGRRKPPLAIEPTCCTACAMCLRVCPEDAVSRAGEVFRIDPERCTGCGACERVCPAACIGPAKSR